MQAPAFPADEEFRLAALRSLELLDTATEADFDSIVRMGQNLFDVPICLISLVDSERQWFKACVGLTASETGRDVSFCGHAILGRSVLVVPDARRDPRFHDNPLVTGGPEIRFYAGAPIWLPSGYPIGTLCIISPVERNNFGAEDISRLSGLAELALGAIALKAMRAEMDRARAELDHYRAALLSIPQPVAVTDGAGRIEDRNEAFAILCPTDESVALPEHLHLPDGPSDELEPEMSAVTYVNLPGADIRFGIRRSPGGYVLIGEPGSEQ